MIPHDRFDDDDDAAETRPPRGPLLEIGNKYLKGRARGQYAVDQLINVVSRAITAAGLAYLVYHGFQSVTDALVKQRTSQVAIVKAIQISAELNRYEHGMMLYQDQVASCVDLLKTRPKDYETLRANWIIEQVKFFCPWVQTPPPKPMISDQDRDALAAGQLDLFLEELPPPPNGGHGRGRR